MSKHRSETAWPDDGAALQLFDATPSPQNAVSLARADHRAGPITDWEFMDALSKAEQRCIAYPRLIEALKNLIEAADAGSWKARRKDQAVALLAELGEI